MNDFNYCVVSNALSFRVKHNLLIKLHCVPIAETATNGIHPATTKECGETDSRP